MSLFDKGKQAALKAKEKLAAAEPSFDAATSSAERRLKALRDAPNTGAWIVGLGIAAAVVLLIILVML